MNFESIIVLLSFEFLAAAGGSGGGGDGNPGKGNPPQGQPGDG
jgi:hypothetical protein